jgi:hypothetical protein
MRFTNAYAHSNCSPSRASLLTGRHAAAIDHDPTQLAGSGVIEAETEINSYFLYFDPVGDPTDVTGASASIRFDDEILGLIIETDSLITSDFILGVVGKYSKATGRGLELDPFEGVIVFDDNHGLIVNLAALGQDFDHLRVVTAATVVPLPVGLQMGLALLIGCAVIAKFRKLLYPVRRESI